MYSNECVCVCMRVYVYMCLCEWWLWGVVVVSGLRSPSSSPTQAIFHLIFHLPPTSPTSPPSCDCVYTWHLLGCKFKAFSHETAMVQVGLRVPTPLAVRKGLFPCDFLARLQELCLHGSQCLLSAQASASGCKRISMCMCASVCIHYACVYECVHVSHVLSPDYYYNKTVTSCFSSNIAHLSIFILSSPSLCWFRLIKAVLFILSVSLPIVK